MELSERLKELRKIKGLTQKDLAEAIGVSLSAIYSYESRRQIPNIQIIFDICKRYDVSADWLLGLDEAPKSMSLAQIVNAIKAIKDNTTMSIKPIQKRSVFGQALVLVLTNEELCQYFFTENQISAFVRENMTDESFFTTWQNEKMKELADSYDDKRRAFNEVSNTIIHKLDAIP